jgi:hypothetical protein
MQGVIEFGEQLPFGHGVQSSSSAQRFAATHTRLCRFSPDGTMLAIALSDKLVVRNAHTLELLHLFRNCKGNTSESTDSNSVSGKSRSRSAAPAVVQRVQWSADSTLVMCVLSSSSAFASSCSKSVHLWCVNAPQYRFAWRDAILPLCDAFLSPDGCSIVCLSDLQVRLSVSLSLSFSFSLSLSLSLFLSISLSV